MLHPNMIRGAKSTSEGAPAACRQFTKPGRRRRRGLPAGGNSLRRLVTYIPMCGEMGCEASHRRLRATTTDATIIEHEERHRCYTCTLADVQKVSELANAVGLRRLNDLKNPADAEPRPAVQLWFICRNLPGRRHVCNPRLQVWQTLVASDCVSACSIYDYYTNHCTRFKQTLAVPGVSSRTQFERGSRGCGTHVVVNNLRYATKAVHHADRCRPAHGGGDQSAHTFRTKKVAMGPYPQHEASGLRPPAVEPK